MGMFRKEEIMSEEEKKFLEIVDLKKGFGSGETRQEVLRGMNFSVAKGEFCVLLGPSGSGKSTLLNIIGGIDNADSGYISIGGDKLEEMSEKKLTQYRRKHLGYVFQMYNLIGNLNVKENIEVGAYLSDHALDIDELFIRWDFMSTDTSSRISSPAVSSREYPSEGRSSRTRIFCSVMSRRAHSIIIRPKRS